MLISLLFLLCLQDTETPPLEPFPETTFLETVRIVHHPPEIMFEGRPYDLECFVNFPTDSIQSVHLFLKTNNMSSYQEISLEQNYDMYSYRYFEKNFPAENIQYFFLIETSNRLFASPLDSVGHIAPISRKLINPVEYYKSKK